MGKRERGLPSPVKLAQFLRRLKRATARDADCLQHASLQRRQVARSLSIHTFHYNKRVYRTRNHPHQGTWTAPCRGSGALVWLSLRKKAGIGSGGGNNISVSVFDQSRARSAKTSLRFTTGPRPLCETGSHRAALVAQPLWNATAAGSGGFEQINSGIANRRIDSMPKATTLNEFGCSGDPGFASVA